MSMVEIRKIVASYYPGKNWARRVWNMPDNQVLAIYFRKEREKDENC